MERADAHFVECSPRPITKFVYTTKGIQWVGEYPTLLELTAEEIPQAPATPSDTTLVAPTSVTDKTGLQAITGSGHYTIDADIDASGDWTPITSFSGVIEGNDYTISNLTINAPSTDYRGMFNSLATGAEIRNLNFADCSVTGRSYGGILAARAAIGAQNLILKNIAFSNCAVSGDDYLGAVIGYATNLKNCKFYDCETNNCNVTGTSVVSLRCGGFFGWFYCDADTPEQRTYIVRCAVNGGTISAVRMSQVGGFAGYIRGVGNELRCGGVYDSYSTAQLVSGPGPSWVGGFAGGFTQFDAISCYSTGDITVIYTGTQTEGDNIGGFLGNATCFHDFVNCYSTGDILLDGTASTAPSLNIDGKIGGFAGYLDMEDTYILRCYTTSAINLSGEFQAWEGIGGFVGSAYMGYQAYYAIAGLVERSWSQGDISLSHAAYRDDSMLGGVGGFIGYLYGFIFLDESMTIRDCYSWSSIEYLDAASNVATGSFIGSIYIESDAFAFTMDNTYAAQTDTAAGSGLTGQIPTGDYSNGFIGYVAGEIPPTVSDSFWDTTTSSIETDDYAQGHVTSWMQTKSNYEAAGWDFDTIWILEMHEV